MSTTDKIKRRIRQLRIPPTARMREKTREDMLHILRQSRGDIPPPTNIWRAMMREPALRYVAMFAAAAAVLFGFMFFDRSPTPAYAIEQTIEAIDTIRTVHFKAELFKQGPVECWMRFDGRNDKPTHMCLFWPGEPVRKIDSPRGSFAYNTATNRVRRTQRDERNKGWHIDFAGFFRKSLDDASRSNDVKIEQRIDPESNEELIVIHVDEKDRQCEYLIDPKTKLPLRFTTTSTSNFMKYYKQTIAVRNMSFIEYNKPVPAGMFGIPEDAEQVSTEHDIIVHPGVGMAVDGLGHEQACEKIVRQVARAMNDRERDSAVLFRGKDNQVLTGR